MCLACCLLAASGHPLYSLGHSGTKVLLVVCACMLSIEGGECVRWQEWVGGISGGVIVMKKKLLQDVYPRDRSVSGEEV